MSTTAVRLFIPCEVFEVQVIATPPPRGLSEIEVIALRAIHAGCDSHDSLTRFLGLLARPTLDLVLQLWRQGHIVIDDRIGSGDAAVGRELSLTRKVAAIIDDVEKLRKLEGGRRQQKKMALMFDLLSGSVVRRMRRPSEVRSIRVAPQVKERGAYNDPRLKADILECLAKWPPKTSSGRPMEILQAFIDFESATDAHAAEIRLLAVDANVFIDEDDNQLKFRVTGPESVPPHVRRSLDRALTQLAIERPEEPFIRNLANEAETREVVRMEDPHGALTRLLDVTMRLTQPFDPSSPDFNPGTLPAVHEQLTTQANRVRELIAEWNAGELCVELLVGPEAIKAAIVDAIELTERQLLLVSAFADANGLEYYEPTLRERLSLTRSPAIDVFVLWGIDRPGAPARAQQTPKDIEDSHTVSALDTEFRRMMKRLGGEFAPNRILFGESPCHTHAKLVVSDASVAIISSFNFLSGSSSGAAELGIRVSARNEASGLICRFAAWARDHSPDFEVSRQIRCTVDGFAEQSRDSTGETEVGAPQQPTIPAQGNAETAAFRAQVDVWRDGWLDVSRTLKARFDALGTQGALVRDGLHRLLLARALKSAERRILVASDRLTEDAIDGALLHLLDKTLKRGVSITFVYRRPSPRLEQRLAEIAQAWPRGFRLFRGPNHAKLLAFDDQLIVTSFNFLSFSGDYGGGRRRVRSELGLHLRDPEMVARAVAGLKSLLDGFEPLGDWTDSARQSDEETELIRTRAETASPEDRMRGRRHAQGLLARLHDAGDAQAARRASIRAWFADHLDDDESWRVIDALPDLERGPASCFLVAHHERPNARWRRQLAQIALAQWQAGHATRSVLLARALEDDDRRDLPPAWLMESATARRGDDLVACIDAGVEALVSSVPGLSAEWIGLECAVVRAVLEFGRKDALDYLGLLPTASASPVRPWLDASKRYAAIVHQPVPFDRLAMIVEHRDAIEAADALRLAHARQHAKIAHNPPQFNAGVKTWQELFSPVQHSTYDIMPTYASLHYDDAVMWPPPPEQTKPMDALFIAVVREDGAAVRAWFEQYGTSDRDLGDLLDAASDRAFEGGPFAGDKVVNPRRRPTLKKLSKVVRAARAWVNALPSGQPDPYIPYVDQALALGRSLLESRAELARFGGQWENLRPIVDALIATVQPLLDEAGAR